MKIAFLGTGLMGAGFVRHLLATGNQVNVWNRTAGKARALESAGAKAFEDAAAAVAGAERIHLSLADDASVDAVLEPLAKSIPQSMNPITTPTTTILVLLGRMRCSGATAGSRAAVGSSRSRRRGCWQRARAMITRCSSPPERRPSCFSDRCAAATLSRQVKDFSLTPRFLPSQRGLL